MDEQQDLPKPVRVAIVGCGELSAYAVYSLFNSEEIEELILIGECPDRLIERVSDLQRADSNASPATYRKGSIGDAARAEIVIIGSEADNPPADIAHESQRVKAIARQLVDLGFDGVLLITVEPVDAMLRTAIETPLSATSVIGLGTQSYNDHDRPVGTSVWCTGAVDDVPFTDLCDPECPYFPKVLEGSRRYWSMASSLSDVSQGDVAICVTRVCEAILSSRRTLIPLWTVGPDGVPRYSTQIAGNGQVSPAAPVAFGDPNKESVEVA
ncbi:MAG TPA: hypothetical protein VFZ49_03015 [Pyrinomonadaceae bacterium]